MSSSFSPSAISRLTVISKPTSCNFFFASCRFSPRISGTSTSSMVSSSCSLSFFNSKYGNTSARICPPTGAATAPPWCPPSPVGLYKVTSNTICGSEMGATPIKEVTYLFVFTPSSEVPVFPPTRKPFTPCILSCTFCNNAFHHA